jgi:hypothetical protein
MQKRKEKKQLVGGVCCGTANSPKTFKFLPTENLKVKSLYKNSKKVGNR